MPIEPKSKRPMPQGLANNTHWNDSGFAFPSNTNVLDEKTMTSDAAARARGVGLASLEASKNRDREEPHQILGPAPSSNSGQLLPLQKWADKLTGKNKKKAEKEVIDGKSVHSEATEETQGNKEKGAGIGK